MWVGTHTRASSFALVVQWTGQEVSTLPMWVRFLPRAPKQNSAAFSKSLLGEKSVRASAPKILNSLGEFGGNPWDALRASHHLALKKPLSSVLVPWGGLEPPTLAGYDSESYAYTRFRHHGNTPHITNLARFWHASCGTRLAPCFLPRLLMLPRPLTAFDLVLERHCGGT